VFQNIRVPLFRSGQYSERVTASATTADRPRGRPAAASREDVVAAAMHRYLRGLRVDVQEIANELGLGRTTIYRWFGSREGLIGEVLVRAAEPLLEAARAETEGRGARALLDTFDRFNRSLAEAPALRQFLQREREAALRVITSSAGPVQPRMVEAITALIEEEVAAGAYEPAIDAATLGYAIVRLAEAFLFNDAIADVRGDVDRLREVEAAILGVR
jgi:AcrR family transcriptional regulator